MLSPPPRLSLAHMHQVDARYNYRYRILALGTRMLPKWPSVRMCLMEACHAERPEARAEEQ